MPRTSPAVALTIAGSDPSGGAGLQADLKTFHRFRVFGQAAVTLLTVQNTRGVSRVEAISAELVAQQIEAVLDDVPPDAIKTGALGNAGIIEAVSICAPRFQGPLVIDPVMVSKNGARLLDDDGIKALRRRLFPHAHLVTPNLMEAAILTGRQVSDIHQMTDAARALADSGAHNVLVKGGHLEGDAVDVLLVDGAIECFPAARIQTRHTHGTGCVLSAAITAGLSCGLPLGASVRRAKDFVSAAIASNPGLGGGAGPLDLWAEPSG